MKLPPAAQRCHSAAQCRRQAAAGGGGPLTLRGLAGLLSVVVLRHQLGALEQQRLQAALVLLAQLGRVHRSSRARGPRLLALLLGGAAARPRAAGLPLLLLLLLLLPLVLLPGAGEPELHRLCGGRQAQQRQPADGTRAGRQAPASGQDAPCPGMRAASEQARPSHNAPTATLPSLPRMTLHHLPDAPPAPAGSTLTHPGWLPPAPHPPHPPPQPAAPHCGGRCRPAGAAPAAGREAGGRRRREERSGSGSRRLGVEGSAPRACTAHLKGIPAAGVPCWGRRLARSSCPGCSRTRSSCTRPCRGLWFRLPAGAAAAAAGALGTAALPRLLRLLLTLFWLLPLLLLLLLLPLFLLRQRRRLGGAGPRLEQIAVCGLQQQRQQVQGLCRQGAPP